MPHRSHLPIAVTYPDKDTLAAIPLERLTALLNECNRWFENMEAFRSGIQSEAGRIEWNVLTRADIEEAAAARVRLRDAIGCHHDAILDGLEAQKTTEV